MTKENKLLIIFCDRVFHNQEVEPEYEVEYNIANEEGFDTFIISFEELEKGNTGKSLQFIKNQEAITKAIYRGWMMKPEFYKNLYNELLRRNIELINNPTQYKLCHYLPESYNLISHITPKSIWTKEINDKSIESLLSQFGNSSVIVKDFVKSEKHYWKEACFIKDASDIENAKTIINNFLKLRGIFLNEGIVLREYEKLSYLSKHSKSNMPIGLEYRVFFLYGKPIGVYKYWTEGAYETVELPSELFIKLSENIQSNFFTMDIAKKKNGEWIVMELGDGQVSELNDNIDIRLFYKTLKVMISI